MYVAFAVVFFLVTSAVWTFPLLLHMADGLSAAPDALLHSWILAWDIHALTTDPVHVWDANVYFPLPLSLTYSDAILSGAVMVAPVLLLTGNAILAHNVLTVASFFVAGCGVYLLVRHLTGSEIGSLVAGSIFAFCSSRQAHLEHVNLLEFGWLPLGLLCMHRAVRTGRTRDLALLALFTVCQVLASVYLAWMTVIAYGMFLALELILRWRDRQRRRAIARVVVALLVALVTVLPAVWPYEQMQQLYGFQWPMDVVGDFSAVPSDYLAVPPQNVMYSPLLARFSPAAFPTEHLLFPGLVSLVLSGVGLSRARGSIEVLRYGLIGLVAFVLSFGPFLRVGQPLQSVALPYWYLQKVVPGFSVMRVPARFDFLVMLTVAVVAGFGLARLSVVLRPRTAPLVRRSVLAGILALALLELFPRPQTLASVSVGSGVPPVYSWLREQDPRAAIAEIPALGDGFAPFRYEYLSTYHWHPLVNGSSGFEPPATKPIIHTLDAFPDPAAVADLTSLGVRFLVAHLADMDDATRTRLAAADLGALGVRLAATFGSDVVYELATPRGVPSLRDHVHIEFPTTVDRGTTPSIAVTLVNNTPQPIFVPAPEALGVHIAWNRESETVAPRQSLPVFFEPQQRTTLVFAVPLPSSLTGASTAELRVGLTGTLDVEETHAVNLADLPQSSDRSALATTLERLDVAPRVRPDAEMTINVTARNTGRAVWAPDPPGTSGTKGVVGLAVQNWIMADGTKLPPRAGSSVHVGWNVSPGQASDLTVTTRAPQTPGHYELVLGMLSESVAWFDEVDPGSRAVVPVDVEP